MNPNYLQTDLSNIDENKVDVTNNSLNSLNKLFNRRNPLKINISGNTS